MVVANRDQLAMRDHRWSVEVIDDARHSNAQSTADGMLLVNTGMMDELTDDQPSIVIGHEIAHVVLGHVDRKKNADLVSTMLLVNSTVVAFRLMVEWYALAVSLLVFLAAEMAGRWRSRRCEAEADHVGLLVSARTCIDVAHGPGLWAQYHAADGQTPSFVDQCVSTHSRMEHLESLVDEAREVQILAGCDIRVCRSS